MNNRPLLSLPYRTSSQTIPRIAFIRSVRSSIVLSTLHRSHAVIVPSFNTPDFSFHSFPSCGHRSASPNLPDFSFCSPSLLSYAPFVHHSSPYLKWLVAPISLVETTYLSFLSAAKAAFELVETYGTLTTLHEYLPS